MPAAKQTLFCCYCALLGDPKEAALRAGYGANRAGRKAATLLWRPEVREEIARYRKALEQTEISRARTGLERLAFGGVGDAVRLLTEEEAALGQIAELDLFCVSEIKRPKGGGFEMKFYDRQKALETLLKIEGGGEERATSLYKALEESAKALGGAVGPDAV